MRLGDFSGGDGEQERLWGGRPPSAAVGDSMEEQKQMGVLVGDLVARARAAGRRTKRKTLGGEAAPAPPLRRVHVIWVSLF